MERLGIGHRALCEAYPRLIVCALSGYGQNGARAGRAGHDLNYVARAGLLGLMGPEDQTPQVPGFQVADIGGGLFAVIAILAALRERDATGKGAVLDVALSEAALPFATAALVEALAGAHAPRGAGVLTGGIAAYNTYATSDGGFVALAALEGKFLQRFCAGAGIAFDPAALVPGSHQVALKRDFAAVFSQRTRDAWSRFAEQHDCCLEPVLEPGEWRSDAELASRGVRFAGATDQVPSFRTPVTPRDAPLGAVSVAGDDGEAVLGDAGFRADEITQLRAARIVR
jgi:crotonobetainyl-CoA:carnitine CoA-transferase CaiB-like acyl-CoA transferase